MKTSLSRLLIERLMRYYQLLYRAGYLNTDHPISSAQMAEALEIDDTQVRKDLAAIKVRGLPRVGFNSKEIGQTIGRILGFDESYSAILIGAGHLGQALCSYPGFKLYGLVLVGIFDSDPEKVGGKVSGLRIESTKKLAAFVQKTHVPMAILTVPFDAAQPLANQLVAYGVKAIWNFAPLNLNVPKGILVRNERISLALAEFSHFFKNSRKTPSLQG